MSGAVQSESLSRARVLGDAIRSASNEIEQTRRMPEQLMDRLHKARLFRMLLPRPVGGDEVEPGIYLRVIEEISRSDASVGWNLFVANSAALLAPHLPHETARTIFANSRAIIAWGPPNESFANAEQGGYRVSGRWSFASGCRNATWMGAHCRVREPDGTIRTHADGRPLVLSLLFPAEKATLIDTWDTIGLRGTASDSYALDDVFVPEAFSGSRERPDDRRESGPLYAFPQQGLYAVGVAGVALGIACAMMTAFISLAHAKTREA